MPQKDFYRGKTQVYFLPGIASTTLAPTAAEVAAGVNIAKDIHDINGFVWKTDQIEVPDMASRFTAKIQGADKADDSSFVFYHYSDANPLFVTLAKDVIGFIVFAYWRTVAPIAGNKVDVWPVVVASAHKMPTVGEDPARWTCDLPITAPPAIEVAVL